MLVLQRVHVFCLSSQGINGLLHLHKLLFPSFPIVSARSLAARKDHAQKGWCDVVACNT